MFPIWFFEGYLTLTVLIFAFGPWSWPVRDPIKLYGFLLLAQIALWLGYQRGINYKSKSIYKGHWKIETLILISLIFNLLWIVPNFMLRMGLNEFSYDSIYKAALMGFTDPGAMFLSKIKAYKEIEETSLLGYITIIITPVLWPLFPLGVVFWDRMKKWMKIGLVVCVLADIVSWIAIGTNKGIADFVMLFPWLLLARKPRILTPVYSRKQAKLAFMGLAFLVILIIFFSMGQYGRGGKASTELQDPLAGITADRENVVMDFLPRVAQGAYASFTSYVTQGYYGLSLALQEPFEWTYGIGNSYFLWGLSRRYLGPTTISDMTYPARIEKYGWPRLERWSSIYTWLACDLTFPGVLLAVFGIGWLFARVWLDVVRNNNPYAVALFPLLIIMLFYFPASNQVLAFSTTAVPFGVFLFLWVYNKKRRVAIKTN